MAIPRSGHHTRVDLFPSRLKLSENAVTDTRGRNTRLPVVRERPPAATEGPETGTQRLRLSYFITPADRPIEPWMVSNREGISPR